MRRKPDIHNIYKRPRLTLEEKKEIWRLAKEGVSGGSIATKLKRGRTTIHTQLKRWEREGGKPF